MTRENPKIAGIFSIYGAMFHSIIHYAFSIGANAFL